ncbi:hypothetical protein OIO90_001761 [Microbotryomycetes sp. JL221]|nr:hypothetical protein OIO90_001761 [Microbotryomycetes sp. JL221]
MASTATKPTTTHVEDPRLAGIANIDDSYAVNENNEPVTVVGTYGQDPNHKPNVPFKAYIVLLLCALASFQNVFYGIAPAANQYAIAGSLRAMDKRIWIVQAAAVPGIATGPIFAIISDLYGRRNLILCIWLLYCVSAIIAMTANNINQVIAGQALAGVSAGISGIMYAVPSEILPSNQRAHVQTAVNWVAGLASIAALIGMGAANQNDPVNGWRWVFRTLLILDAVILIGFAAFYFPPPRTASRDKLMDRIKALDWIGYGLLLAGLVPFLMGFAWAGDSNYGWKSAHSYGPVAVGGAILIACVLYEWKGTSTGFLDHRLFREGRNFPIALCLIAVEGSLFYLINNIYTGQVNSLWTTAPGSIAANARVLPFFMAVQVVSPFISIYVTKTKDLKWPLFAGFLMFTACVVGLAMSGLNATMGTVFNGIGGIGFATPLILLMTLVQLSTPPLFIGVASALVISIRTLGGVVGLAIADAIFGSLTNSQIPDAIAKTAVSMGLPPQSIGPLIVSFFSHSDPSTVPGATGPIIGAAFTAAKEVQAHGYKIVWFAFLPGTVIAAVVCALFHNPRERMNWVVDAPLDLPKGHVEDHEASSAHTTEEKR